MIQRQTFIIFVAFIIAVIMYINIDIEYKRKVKQMSSDIKQLEFQLSKYESTINDMQENDTTLYNNYQTYLNNCE